MKIQHWNLRTLFSYIWSTQEQRLIDFARKDDQWIKKLPQKQCRSYSQLWHWLMSWQFSGEADYQFFINNHPVWSLGSNLNNNYCSFETTCPVSSSCLMNSLQSSIRFQIFTYSWSQCRNSQLSKTPINKFNGNKIYFAVSFSSEHHTPESW